MFFGNKFSYRFDISRKIIGLLKISKKIFQHESYKYPKSFNELGMYDNCWKNQACYFFFFFAIPENNLWIDFFSETIVLPLECYLP